MTTKHYSLYFILAFMAISLFAIGASCPMIPYQTYPLEYAFKQFQWYLLAFVVIAFLYKRNYQKLFIPLYVLSLIGVWLLAIQHQLTIRDITSIHIPFSTYVNGSTAWFTFPGLGSIQPSEFLKVGHIILLARLTSTFNPSSLKDELVYLLKVGALTLVSCLGILLQNDSGVTLILLSGTIFILFNSKLPKRYFVVGFILLTGIVILFIIKTDFHSPDVSYRIERILGWLSPETYYDTFGYQLYNSKLSYQTAGLFGHGFQNIVMYYPEAQTDFIFPVILCNGGFVLGTITLLLCLGFDLYILKLTNFVDDYYSHLLVGYVGLIAFSQVWNIAMTLGLLPITGITLPFISYGGSSLISEMILLPTLLNIENKIR